MSQPLNQKAMLLEAVNSFFDTMLSIPVEPCDLDFPPIPELERLLGGVAFTGDKVKGHLWASLSESLGKIIAASMLGVDPSEVTDAGQVDDIVGEMCNIVGGTFKARLCDVGLNCVLGVPVRKRGMDAVVPDHTSALKEGGVFKFKGHLIFFQTEIEQFSP